MPAVLAPYRLSRHGQPRRMFLRCASRADQSSRRPDLHPRLGDEELLEQPDRIAIGHAGEKVLRRDVDALRPRRCAGRETLRAAAGPSPTGRRECPRPCRTRPSRSDSRRPHRTGNCAGRPASLQAPASLIRISVRPPSSVCCTTSVTILPMRSDDDGPSSATASLRQAALAAECPHAPHRRCRDSRRRRCRRRARPGPRSCWRDAPAARRPACRSCPSNGARCRRALPT